MKKSLYFKNLPCFAFGLIFCLIFQGPMIVSAAEGETAAQSLAKTADDFSSKPLEDLVLMSWAASSRGDYKGLDDLVNLILKKHEQEAMSLHSGLNAFPSRDKVDDYKVLNHVATALFVRAEALMHQGKTEESVAAFKDLVKNYSYAQSWDPSRGSYWSIAEKSQASVDQMTGVKKEEEKKVAIKTIPELFKPGTDKVVDYNKYGTFSGVGTKEYKYKAANLNALARAVGEGIYPNTGDVLQNPKYKEAYKASRLNGGQWDFVNTFDLEAAYFKWATAPEHPGVKLFYTGLIFEKSRMYYEAIKAYHALIVHFSNTVAWTYWQTPWYPAQAALAKIKNIIRQHPELKLVYRNAKVRILNATDNDAKNDAFIVSPGVLEQQKVPAKINLKVIDAAKKKVLGQPKRSLGGKKVRLVQYQNGHWLMFAKDKPFILKAITYAPTKVGQSPDKGTLESWMVQDIDKNGTVDSPYESWVDKNGNNIQDKEEPVVGDFQLLKEMGVTAIRLYHHPSVVNKELLRDLYDRYGIMVVMGDYLGKYAIGSGAEWAKGTDYENPEHRAKMLESVEKMVREFKDEPYILMWVLGNENNYGVACNADKKPAVYYQFVNEVTKKIKEIDPDRPVAICNGDTLYLDIFAKNAPDVDMFGANVYRGDYGFGSFWDEVRQATNKPAFITEYGAPAYGKDQSLEEAENAQAAYHKGSWLDIMANAAGEVDGEGNAIGGIAFEWMDEWWKNYEPSMHDTKADVIGPFAGGYYFEEWFGIVGQGDGKSSPYMRQLRKAYYIYKELWNQ